MFLCSLEVLHQIHPFWVISRQSVRPTITNGQTIWAHGMILRSLHMNGEVLMLYIIRKYINYEATGFVKSLHSVLACQYTCNLSR